MDIYDIRQRGRINAFYNYIPSSALSVDPMVWPSIFDTGIAPGFSHEDREKMGYSGYSTPAWIGRFMNFWDNYDYMIDFYNSINISHNNSVPVLFSNTSDSSNNSITNFIGFDVCVNFISLISNYYPSKILDFKEKLNGCFLFADHNDAVSFAKKFEHLYDENDIEIWSINIFSVSQHKKYDNKDESSIND